jgi:hypothetical protein
MTIYTVHEPPPRDEDAAADTDRFVFVRDGFYGWAFLLGPLWMLWHRLWLVLLGYIALTAALQIGLWFLAASGLVKFVVGVLISLLIGMEAASLRRWTLNRRKWKNLGVVVASDVETAERRFFDTWVERKTPVRTTNLPPAATLRLPPASSEVIGLFPEPEGRR